MKKLYLLSLLLILSSFPQCNFPFPPTEQTTGNARFTGSIAQKAMVVSAHPMASKVGVEILQKGGNAIDAAVAVQLALAVVYPSAGNLGGGGFMVYRSHSGEITALDFREKAPAQAHRNMYLDSLGNVIPRLSLDGHLAAGVPGTVDGCVKMHQKYGKLPFADLVAPAIKLAEEGVRLFSEVEPNRYNEKQEAFRKMNTFTEDKYLLKKEAWKAGDTLIQKDLAETLKRVQTHGEAGFYEGKTADLIVAEMKKGNGIITHEDLKNYEAVWRKPIVGNYKNHRIISMPPPSSGGIALVQLLKMVAPFPLAKWGFHSPEAVHHIVEAERRVYADRATHLGDSDFYKVPIEGLLEANYLKKRMADFDVKQAVRSDKILAGKPKGVAESEETTHLSIVDAEGNAVSVTTTLNASFGSKTFVDGAGFLLNNEMDDFSAKPGTPNLYGLVGGEANAIEPNKRMLSSMTPTIVEKDGKLLMVVGSPGGSTIITSVFQTILNVLEYNMGMQEAVNAARFHHQWLPDKVFIEKNAFEQQANTKEQLQKMGHTFKERSPIGRVDAILLLPDGTLEGGADIRGEDAALGF